MNQLIEPNHIVHLTAGGGRRMFQQGKIRIRTLLLILLGLLCLGGIRVYWLWQTPPTYWQEHQQFLQQTTAEKRMETAQSVEQRILDQLSFVSNETSTLARSSHTQVQAADASNVISAAIGSADPNKTKVVFITLEEINAWMDQRLRDWSSHQGTVIPDYVSDPMVAIEGENLVLAFRFDRSDFQQVISAVTRVQIEQGQSGKAGKATIQIVKIRTGRLSVPGAKAMSGAIGKTGDVSSGFAKVATEITEAFDGMVFDPLIKISQQKVRMVSFSLSQNPAGMEITIRADNP